jgi:predicted permease
MKKPPRLAKALLSLCVPPGIFRDSALGDLEEGFHERVSAKGDRNAATWYWLQAARLSVRYLVERTAHRRVYSARPESKRGGGSILDSTVHDVRFALRTLRRRPLFATVAALTLGLGIGATTAMFSVVDGVLLTRLPYSEPGRLVAIWQTMPDLQGIPGDDGARWDRYRFAYPQYRDLTEESTRYEGLAAYRAGNPDVATLSGVGDPVELPAGAASASFLHLLGVRPALGRWFLPGEEASRAGNDGASVAVVSYELWQGRFGGSQETLGRIVTLDDRPFEIVGILPPGFHIQWLSASIAGESVPARRDVWFPIGAPGWNASPWGYSWEIVGRLGPGVTIEQAHGETSSVLAAHPNSAAEGEIRVIPRANEETRGLSSPLVLLFGATAFLLIIACGNIATLSVAEVLSRRHEIATRSALGARSPRIVRLFLTESLVLAALGSGVGAALAYCGTGVLVALAPPIPRLHEVGIDIRVLGFAVLSGTCTAFLFGAVPSVLASRGAFDPTWHSSPRTSQVRPRFSGTVIAIQIAMTVVLLVAGGLLTRSLWRLLAVDPGFDASGLATVEVRLPLSRYPFLARAERAAFVENVLERLEAVPDIGTVTAVSRLPFPGQTSAMNMRVGERYFNPLYYQVAPGYFETLGVPLLAGRSLSKSDGPDTPLAVVVNETAARRFWPDESPVGAQVTLSFPKGPVTVVGVVGDMKRQVLTAQTEPAFFISFGQLADETVCFIARTQMDSRDALPLMSASVRSVDGELVVKNSTTVADLIASSADHERYRTLLLNFFGILAAFLAAAGVFGVTARGVALRTRELGIRMALGARGSGLIGVTVRGALYIGITGTAVGMLGALWSSRLLSRFLYGVEPWDPTTYAIVATLIVMVCLVASYAPARRITNVNPVEVLRAE